LFSSFLLCRPFEKKGGGQGEKKGKASTSRISGISLNPSRGTYAAHVKAKKEKNGKAYDKKEGGERGEAVTRANSFFVPPYPRAQSGPERGKEGGRKSKKKRRMGKEGF